LLRSYVSDIRYGQLVELGSARVSTVKQDLDRQIEALAEAGIDRERIYVDKKSGATVDRPGLRALLGYARDGDVIVVRTLDRLGRRSRRWHPQAAGQRGARGRQRQTRRLRVLRAAWPGGRASERVPRHVPG
jgi:hypothetical protein